MWLVLIIIVLVIFWHNQWDVAGQGLLSWI